MTVEAFICTRLRNARISLKSCVANYTCAKGGGQSRAGGHNRREGIVACIGCPIGQHHATTKTLSPDVERVTLTAGTTSHVATSEPPPRAESTPSVFAGEPAKRRRLTHDDKLTIATRRAAGEKLSTLAAEYGYTEQHISHVALNVERGVTPPTPPPPPDTRPKSPHRKVASSDHAEITRRRLAGETVKQLASAWGCTTQRINQIVLDFKRATAAKLEGLEGATDERAALREAQQDPAPVPASRVGGRGESTEGVPPVSVPVVPRVAPDVRAPAERPSTASTDVTADDLIALSRRLGLPWRVADAFVCVGLYGIDRATTDLRHAHQRLEEVLREVTR